MCQNHFELTTSRCFIMIVIFVSICQYSFSDRHTFTKNFRNSNEQIFVRVCLLEVFKINRMFIYFYIKSWNDFLIIFNCDFVYYFLRDKPANTYHEYRHIAYVLFRIFLIWYIEAKLYSLKRLPRISNCFENRIKFEIMKYETSSILSKKNCGCSPFFSLKKIHFQIFK